MIHISSAGCGWEVTASGYTCSGLPKLDIAFSTTSLTGRVVDNEAIDHYDYIPQQIEGFLMTLSPILQMDGRGKLEVPELACRVNFDPFYSGSACVLNTDTALPYNEDTVNTGFLDLYNQVPQYTSNFYVTVDGETSTMPEGSFPSYLELEGGTAILSEMGPGILEPMINTSFGEINVDVPPTPDLTIDAIIYSLVGLQGWRHAIDTRINHVMINAADTGMENLEAAKNMEGPCANFQIKVKSGYPFASLSVFGSTNTVVPKYWITSGDITINGFPVTIQGTTHSSYPEKVRNGVDAPFYAYLEYWPITTGTTITGYTGTIKNTQGPYSPASPDHKIVEIGRVKPISNIAGSTISITSGGSTTTITGSTALNSPFPLGSSYMLFEIEQGECIENIETLNAKNTGYLYQTATTGGKQYTTDPLLDDMENLTTATAWRGVQAQAISAYVAAHGGGSTGDGRMYPDYAALATGEGTVPSGIGIGVTYVLPVSKGQPMHYMTEVQGKCFVRYAPALEEEGAPITLAEGADVAGQVAPADGFVRFTILDDGLHQGKCVRFSTATSPTWESSLPVYRFGNFQLGYNGPFRVDGNGGISCPVCDQPELSTDPRIIGHCIFNGMKDAANSDVHSDDIAGVTHGINVEAVDLVGVTTDVYLHVKGIGQYVIDTNDTITTETGGPPAYTVWLARITGATETVDELTGTTTYHNGYATQIHHGDIYVDGRWQ